MAPARDRLRKAIADASLLDLDIPVVANIDARPHTEASEWSSLLSAQLVSPVRWRQSVRWMADQGVHTFIELGPGNVLTGMAKRIVPEARAVSVAEPADVDALLELLNGPAPTLRRVEGEHLSSFVRMVVSPAAGIFEPAPGAVESAAVAVGGLLGSVSGTDVRSAFAGTISGMLAVAGERVTSGQPIAWLEVG
jgi:[acyl-carrier-protein] S-malonyltransferase